MQTVFHIKAKTINGICIISKSKTKEGAESKLSLLKKGRFHNEEMFIEQRFFSKMFPHQTYIRK